MMLSEISRRRLAIHALLTGTQQLSAQLSGLVQDNQEQLDPTLRALDQVTAMLRRNQGSLDHALAVAGPYYRLIGNTLGNGRWFDSYLCGLVPNQYVGRPADTPCMPPKQQGGR
jgi:phospholipid/cholesterol/gamma-HCH transport system substrate-binding protein